MQAGARHGYHYYLQDAGPKYGVSVSVENVSEDLVVTLHVTNTFIRHMPVFKSFLKEDGKTVMKVPPELWLELLQGDARELVGEWLSELQTELGEFSPIGNDERNFCGIVSAESTFMGVPVSASSSDISFKLPSGQGPVGKVRIHVGSLGVNSHNDWGTTSSRSSSPCPTESSAGCRRPRTWRRNWRAA